MDFANLPPITIQFANQVLRLRRNGTTVAEIARALARTEPEVFEAHRMLGIALGGEVIDRAPMPSDVERAALRERMPKRMQERIEKGRPSGGYNAAHATKREQR